MLAVPPLLEETADDHHACGPAKGLYPLAAAVEWLVRAADGRFASPGYPWIQPCDQPGWWWLDHEAITDDNVCALSGGEQRILRIVASLAGGQPANCTPTCPASTAT